MDRMGEGEIDSTGASNRRSHLGTWTWMADLPIQTPRGLSHPEQQHQEGASLEHISRMLMEDDEEDMDGRSSSLQYHDDHPVLVQVQQSLAQIISSSSSSSDDGRALLPDEPDSTFSIDDTGTKNVAGEAEDSRSRNASKFLPRDSSSLVLLKSNKPGTGIAITTNGEGTTMPGTGSEVSRASKLMAMTEPEEQEESLLYEMVNRMMLDDCEVSREEMKDLRTAIEKEASARARGKARQRRRKQQVVVVDLHALLVRCAETAMEDHRGARELLEKIRRHASATGDGTQRLAHCFADALEARLAGTVARPSPLFAAREPSSSVVESLEAYRLYLATCCFKRVAFAFSNMSIHRAAAGRSRLHVVDYGVGFGFQWASLLRTLADREGGPPEVTVTGIDLPRPGFRPAGHIERTGHLLSNCARALGVRFKFQAVAAGGWDTVRVEDLSIDPDAALVVNSAFRLETLADRNAAAVGDRDRASPRDVVLGNIRRMRPAVFTVGVVNLFQGSSFLTRFREALFNYSAVFDVLDATMPRGSQHRLVLEREILSPVALNIVACEGRDRTDPFDSYKQWQRRMQRAGLRQLPLDRDVVGAVRGMVKQQQYHKDFLVEDDDRWLLQGWKGRILFAHSTWTDLDG